MSKAKEDIRKILEDPFPLLSVLDQAYVQSTHKKKNSDKNDIWLYLKS